MREQFDAEDQDARAVRLELQRVTHRRRRSLSWRRLLSLHSDHRAPGRERYAAGGLTQSRSAGQESEVCVMPKGAEEWVGFTWATFAKAGWWTYRPGCPVAPTVLF